MPIIYGQNEYQEVTAEQGQTLLAAGLVEAHPEYPEDFSPTPYGENEPWDEIIALTT